MLILQGGIFFPTQITLSQVVSIKYNIRHNVKK